MNQMSEICALLAYFLRVKVKGKVVPLQAQFVSPDDGSIVARNT